MTAAAPRQIVLYDRDCGFCRWALAKILAADRGRTLRPVPLQDPEAERLLGGMNSEERMASWHLVGPDGEVRSGGEALAPLFRELPGGAPLAALAERLPAAAVRGYRWVAEHRTVFGKPVTEGAKRRADVRIAERAGDPPG